MNKTLESICTSIDFSLKGFRSLTGGDINAVFWMQTPSDEWVIKLNDAHRFPGMFEAEAKGLQLLYDTQSFQIPKVHTVGYQENTAYLLMEYLPQGNRDSHFWESFGRNLARLHRHTSDYFGLDHDNYIGSLPQHNTPKENASSFYIEQRLEPQFQLASNQGFSFSVDTLYKNLENEIPSEAPSLVHGDLWNGNYLVTTEGQPALIDPAVAFAPREMDLGMMQLFGGFPEAVFSSYQDGYPLIQGWKKRLPIWQLYYLLVHLNLFGGSYHAQVKRIVDQFS